MAATVEGAFVILDRASGPMGRMKRQAEQLDKAIQGVHGNMKTWDDELKKKQGDLSRTERSLRNFERSARTTGTTVRGVAKDHDTLGNAVTRLGRTFAALRNIIRPAIYVGLGTAIGVAIQAVGALSAGAVGLIPKLADLSGLVGALPAGLTAIGGAAITAKLALGGLTQAYAGSEAALKKLTPQARRFVAFLHEVAPRFRQIRAEAQKGLFPGLESALKQLSSGRAVGTFQSIIGRFGRTLGGLASGAAQAIADPANLQRLNVVATQGAQVLGRLGAALIPLYGAFLKIGVAARPMVNWMTKGISEWLRGRAAAVDLASASGRLTQWFDRTRQSVQRLSSIGHNLWETFTGLGRAARPLGESLWKGIDRTTKAWADFVNSVSGQGILRTQFDAARQSIGQIAGLVGDLGKAIFELGSAPGLVTTTQALRGAVEPLKDLFGNLATNLGPQIARLVTELAKMLSLLVGSGGGIERIVSLMADLAESANTLLEAIKPLGPLISAAFVVGAIRGLAAWVSRSAAAVFGLAEAWKETAIQAGGAAAAQRAAGTASMSPYGGRFGRAGANVGVNAPMAPMVLAGGRQTSGVVGGGGGFRQPFRNMRAAYYGGGRGFSGLRAAGSRGLGMAGEAIGGLRAGAGAGGLAGRGLAGIGGGLLRGGAGLAKFLGPVGLAITGLMAGEAFSHTEGGFGRKLQGAGSSLTFGLVNQPQSAEELSGKGQQAAMQELQSHAYTYQQTNEAILKLKQDMVGADRFDRAEMQGGLEVLQQYADQQKQVLMQQQQADLGQVLAGRGGLRSLAGRGVGARRITQLGLPRAVKRGDLPEVQVQGAQGLIAILKRQTGGAGKVWRETTEMVVRRLQKLGIAADVVAGKLVTGQPGEAQGFLTKFLNNPAAQNRASGATKLTDVQKRWVRSIMLTEGESRANATERVLAREPKSDPRGGGNLQGLSARANQRDRPVKGPGGLVSFPDLSKVAGPLGKALGNARRPIRKFSDDSRKDFKNVKDWAIKHTNEASVGVKKNWDNLRTALLTDNKGMLTDTLAKFGGIQTALRSKLGALGLSGAALQAAMTGGGGGATASGGAHAGGAQAQHGAVMTGGARHAQGGRLAGRGLQDTIPVPGGAAAPGEMIVNRHTERRLNNILGVAGTNLEKEVAAETRPHSQAFAKGGRARGGGPGIHGAGSAPGGVPGHPELQQGISAVTEAVLKQFPGLTITSTTGGGHVSGSYHYQGEATDISGSSAVMLQAANWIKASGLSGQLTEGIHNPNLSVSDGHTVPNSFYSSVWAQHANHIHLAVAHAVNSILGGAAGGAAGAAAGGALGRTVPPIKAPQGFKGRGSARQAASQSALNALTRGANKKLTAASGAGAIGGGGPAAYNHQFPWDSTQAIPQGAVASIAEAAGLPGLTFAQIAHGESSFQPGAVGHDPGGTTGLGLWQITTGVGHDALIAQLGGEKAMLNPIINAQAAKSIYDSSGIGAWYGTQYLTSPNAHVGGGGKKALGGRIPWYGRGMEGVARRPTVIGVGESGSENISVSPRSHGTAGSGGPGRGLHIEGGVHISTGSGDPAEIRKAVEEGIVEAARQARDAGEESEAVLS